MSKSYIALALLTATFGGFLGWNYHPGHLLLITFIDSAVATIMTLSIVFAISRMFISNGNRS